jgi:hypothetical protein
VYNGLSIPSRQRRHGHSDGFNEVCVDSIGSRFFPFSTIDAVSSQIENDGRVNAEECVADLAGIGGIAI